MLVPVMKKPLNKSTTILIKGGVVLTVNPSENIFPEGYVLIENDTIKSIGTIETAPPDDAVQEVIDARDGLIMPGLINTHTHAAMACLRGLADDLPLETWLNDYIFPVEAHDYVVHLYTR